MTKMNNHTYEFHDGLDEAHRLSTHDWVPRETGLLDKNGNPILHQPKPIGFVTDYKSFQKNNRK